jgi:hypothetical protein
LLILKASFLSGTIIEELRNYSDGARDEKA